MNNIFKKLFSGVFFISALIKKFFLIMKTVLSVTTNLTQPVYIYIYIYKSREHLNENGCETSYSWKASKINLYECGHEL